MLLLPALNRATAKRVEEALLLQVLLDQTAITLRDFKDLVFSRFRFIPSDLTIDSVCNNLNFNFITERGQKKSDGSTEMLKVGAYRGYSVVAVRGDEVVQTPFWLKLCENPAFVAMLRDVLDFGIDYFSRYLTEK